MGCAGGATYRRKIRDLYLENQQKEEVQNDLLKKYRKLQQQIDILERNIERGNGKLKANEIKFEEYKREKKLLQTSLIKRFMEEINIRLIGYYFDVWRVAHYTAAERSRLEKELNTSEYTLNATLRENSQLVKEIYDIRQEIAVEQQLRNEMQELIDVKETEYNHLKKRREIAANAKEAASRLGIRLPT